MKFDVTDATFEQEVVERSKQTPVVVDLWAPWCGPCRTLGPLLEQAVDATGGEVVLAKVNVDENQQTAGAFRVQGIPAVYAMKDGEVVDGFVGAQGPDVVNDFVNRLLPTEEDLEIQALIEKGDEASLRSVLELEADHERAGLALAAILVDDGRSDEGLEILARLPESAESRRLAALARTGADVDDDEIDAVLDGLLERVKGDDAARAEFLDLLERLGPDDPRTSEYRRKLTAQLF